ncbi:MAG: sigma 54-interacting transcriptional regulator, partial [bacterium]|nr:sigma 54-interacting transcriptional regulator [bacterium]
MGKYSEILLEVFREACRHIEITESMPNISKIVQQHLPVSQMLISSLNSSNLQITTIAAGFHESCGQSISYYSKKCTQNDADRLIAWCQKGQILYRDRSNFARDLFDTILTENIWKQTEVLVCPLKQQSELFPFLIFIAHPKAKFTLRHREMVKILIEPISLAIENDCRVREIVRLREAAEADKKTLLTKLSRNKIDDTIVGAETGLAKVMERVRLVARSDVPVIIFGETGTGKEVIARAIHNNSARVAGPFIRVNCGAIPSELIDSQLFGHERGAFTGAVESRKGWFERADGGTLLLDEVAELPLPAQVRFLRILQDGWLERVGGKHPIKVDVRIVLATHRDLATMVAKGKFREDLWYRIA